MFEIYLKKDDKKFESVRVLLKALYCIGYTEEPAQCNFYVNRLCFYVVIDIKITLGRFFDTRNRLYFHKTTLK